MISPFLHGNEQTDTGILLLEVSLSISVINVVSKTVEVSALEVTIVVVVVLFVVVVTSSMDQTTSSFISKIYIWFIKGLNKRSFME